MVGYLILFHVRTINLLSVFSKCQKVEISTRVRGVQVTQAIKVTIDEADTGRYWLYCYAKFYTASDIDDHLR